MPTGVFKGFVGSGSGSSTLRFSEMQDTCDGCFAHQSVCSVISLHSDKSWAVHPHEFLKVDVEH